MSMSHVDNELLCDKWRSEEIKMNLFDSWKLIKLLTISFERVVEPAKRCAAYNSPSCITFIVLCQTTYLPRVDPCLRHDDHARALRWLNRNIQFKPFFRLSISLSASDWAEPLSAYPSPLSHNVTGACGVG